MLDGGNGMAGPMVGPILERLDGLELVPTYWEPDGEFPDHEPNPLLPENREFIIRKVREEGADLGIAWDGDADRCFFIDETGEFVARRLPHRAARRVDPAEAPGRGRSSTTSAPRGRSPTPSRRPAGARSSTASATPSSRPACATRAASFGGEVSGHYYFADFYNADSGTIPALLILELLGQKGATLSELLAPYRAKYFISGEINSEVEDPAGEDGRSSRSATPTPTSASSTASRSTTTTGTSTCGRRTPSRCCASPSSRSSPQEDMEAKRDEVLGLIRS